MKDFKMKKVKLEEIAIIYNNYRYDYNYNNIIYKKENKYIKINNSFLTGKREIEYIDYNNRILKKGDILISDFKRIGPQPNNALFLVDENNKYTLSTPSINVIVIRPKEEINSEYLFHQLNNNKKLLNHLSNNISELREVSILFPENIEDQLQLSNLFSSLNELTDLKNQEIITLEQYKQALAEKIFF